MALTRAGLAVEPQRHTSTPPARGGAASAGHGRRPSAAAELGKASSRLCVKADQMATCLAPPRPRFAAGVRSPPHRRKASGHGRSRWRSRSAAADYCDYERHLSSSIPPPRDHAAHAQDRAGIMPTATARLLKGGAKAEVFGECCPGAIARRPRDDGISSGPCTARPALTKC